MRMIPVSALGDREVLMEIRRHLGSGGLIVYPTDTLYGVGCNLFSDTGRNKIDVLKQRKDLPYSAAVSSIDHIKGLISGSLDPLHLFLKWGSFHGMTFLFRLNENIDNRIVKKSDLIGIRVFDTGPLHTLIKFTGEPVITTSVNLTGRPPVNTISEVRQFITNSPLEDDTFIIDGGDLPVSRGSTIIDLSGDKARLVRSGDNFRKIKEILKKMGT